MKNDLQNNKFLLYKTDTWNVKVDVLLQDENIWMSQKNIAELFWVDRTVVTKHLKNIFETWELDEKTTSAKNALVQKEWNREITRDVSFYNLDAIIATWYRVNSMQATKFRIWATERLKEYIVKWFTIDDERLKQWWSKSRYFEELLQRIRDIRSSERNFYQKVTDIYATSIDYKKDTELTREFFATVQNKMHFAVHGKTASELISERVDSQKENVWLTNFKWDYVTKKDIVVAKNYLSEDELKQLNLIVSMYLDFAELQAINWQLMKMKDWIEKLDYFLTWANKRLLKNAWKISHEEAIQKAINEYDEYRKIENKNYLSDFDKEVKKLKSI